MATKKAQSPLDLHALWAERFNAGDIEGVLSLYEPDAVLRVPGGPTATGIDEIRGSVQGFLTMNPTLEFLSTDYLHSGDIAIVFSRWTLKATDPGGAAIDQSGTTSDVVRRQADGSWLYVLDVPDGGRADA
jgi:uncharacterized protein (TIGR02246 family)